MEGALAVRVDDLVEETVDDVVLLAVVVREDVAVREAEKVPVRVRDPVEVAETVFDAVRVRVRDLVEVAVEVRDMLVDDVNAAPSARPPRSAECQPASLFSSWREITPSIRAENSAELRSLNSFVAAGVG